VIQTFAMNHPKSQRVAAVLAVRSGPADWFRSASWRMRINVGLAIVLGLVSFFSLILGVSTIVAEHQFGVRRERFLSEGTPVEETLRGKRIGRRTRSFIIAPADSKAFEGEPGPSDGRWVRVHRPTYERYAIGDRIGLLRIGDDFFVRDDEFYSRFRPRVCFLASAVGIAAVCVIVRMVRRSGP
jgi:hypothetical protein